MQPGNPAYVSQLNGLKGLFGGNHAGPAATHMAQATIYNQLNRQAGALAYQDIFRLLFWMALVMIGCAFLLSKNKPGQGAPAGEAVH